MNVTIIGAGNVGTALANGFHRGGHSATVAVRDPDRQRPELDPEVTRASLDHLDPATLELVVLAVPAASVESVIPGLHLQEGTIVVDATNAVSTPVPGGAPTMADHVATLLPDGVALVKAFNTVGAEHLGVGVVDDQPIFLPIGGDQPATDTVAELATAIGFDAVVLGDRTTFGLIEGFARLWIHLAFRNGWGRRFAFAAVGGRA